MCGYALRREHLLHTPVEVDSMEQNLNIKRKRGERGPGKKPALAHVSLRVPAETREFFERFKRPTYAMRRVLEEFAKKHS